MERAITVLEFHSEAGTPLKDFLNILSDNITETKLNIGECPFY